MSYFFAQPVWFTVLCAVLLVGLFAGFVPLGYPGRIERRCGVPVPEASPLYSRKSVQAFLQQVGPAGAPGVPSSAPMGHGIRGSPGAADGGDP